MIDELLEGNRRFIEEEFTTHLDYYRMIAKTQTPRILWIGCSDSRVSEDVITGSRPGTIFVHRNVANIVAYNDVNVAAIVEYAVKHLKVPDIVVCGHYGCGGIAAIEDGVDDHYIADWLLIASGAKEKVDRIAAERELDREQKLDLLTEENVKLQIKHLRTLSLIKHAQETDSAPRIHGWVYSVQSGALNVLVDGREPPAESD